jgi:hypothetical protein
MADNFDMKQFLMENKLGAYSRLKEETINESEITYEFGSDGRCYRVDDEGNRDAVSDSYCQRYAGQGVREEKEEAKEDIGGDIGDAQAEKMMDFLAEKEKEEVKEALTPEMFERMDAIASNTAQIAMIKAAEIMMNQLTEEGFEVLDIREYFTQLIANDI